MFLDTPFETGLRSRLRRLFRMENNGCVSLVMTDRPRPKPVGKRHFQPIINSKTPGRREVPLMSRDGNITLFSIPVMYWFTHTDTEFL